MPTALQTVPAAAPQSQFALWCASCGQPGRLVRGLCAPCYAARRHDLVCFGGLRLRVLARDRHRCRLCGQEEGAARRLHVHHRRPGLSREKLLLSLCPACHARIHRLRVLDRLLDPFAAELWRELHPGAAEQLLLDFEQKPEEPPAAAPVWLWESCRAG